MPQCLCYHISHVRRTPDLKNIFFEIFCFVLDRQGETVDEYHIAIMKGVHAMNTNIKKRNELAETDEALRRKLKDVLCNGDGKANFGNDHKCCCMTGEGGD